MPERVTAADAFEEFLITQQVKGNSPRTLEYYRNSVLPFLSSLPSPFLSDLTHCDLNAYYLRLSSRGLSSVSVQSYVRGIRAFLSWCYAEEYLSKDLTDKFRLPKAQRKTIDILTDREAGRLMSFVSGRDSLSVRNYCICALMLDSGLRKGEVVSLSRSGLHLSDGYAIVTGKGNKQRVVPLGLHTRKHLAKYLNIRPESLNTDRVFLTAVGTPITDSTIRDLFRKLKKGTLIPRLRPHLLRHTFATRYLENGGNIYDLQRILGHTSLEMVKKYLHLTTRKTVQNFVNHSPLDNLKKR